MREKEERREEQGRSLRAHGSGSDRGRRGRGLTRGGGGMRRKAKGVEGALKGGRRPRGL